MVMAKPHVLIMAGGTGGHVFPALAVADELRSRGIDVSWIGTKTGLEARVISKADIPIYFIKISGLRGKGIVGWLLAPFKLVVAVIQALSIVKKINPTSVLGMGGFASGPGGVAAWLLRRPLVLHEQNAIVGMTNKLLAHLATRLLEAFPGAFNDNMAEHVGNPVRKEILDLPEPVARYQQREGAIRILVIGGSLGAKALNDVVPQAIAALPESITVEILHQSGRNKLESTEQNYQKHNIQATVTSFIEDMAGAYGWADLVICRAGALTISELSTAGLAAIFIPYPYAVDDHQTLNAQYMVDAGAACLMKQQELTVEKLTNNLQELIGEGRQQLLKMAQAARSCAKPNATNDVADICLEVANG
jgi:UDP-N-acetylglucosamine--N-acetylmuramyl-(pentapeptide) pyrophosphoryl-undecaprenol N-acetylglucosamine transferase